MATYDELKSLVESADTEEKRQHAFLTVVAAAEAETDEEERYAITALLARETGNLPEPGDESDQTPVADIDVEEDEP